MAGYSGTPLPKKLGIKEGARVAAVDAPEDFAQTLGELPPGAELGEVDADGPIDVIVAFARGPEDVAERFAKLKDRLTPAGGLWIVRRKNRPGTTLVTETLVRESGLAAGLVDNKVCAIDDEWSGLRFVRRLRDR
jgi:hypothetical protein